MTQPSSGALGSSSASLPPYEPLPNRAAIAISSRNQRAVDLAEQRLAAANPDSRCVSVMDEIRIPGRVYRPNCCLCIAQESKFEEQTGAAKCWWKFWECFCCGCLPTPSHEAQALYKKLARDDYSIYLAQVYTNGTEGQCPCEANTEIRLMVDLTKTRHRA
jgi:hypothetical protein